MIDAEKRGTGVPKLGRFENVPLRKVWATEDRAFTPWLATEENIDLLVDVLGLPPLELIKTELPVGPFRADIVCKAVGSNELVLIENQIERSDHIHLGQILTYAAGLEAAYIVWVTSSFRDEHRAAIDWLNDITAETFNFFAVEIEAWRIGDSLPAPRFNVVAKPNDWTRAIQRTAREATSNSDPALREYWRGLNRVLAERDFPLTLPNEPPKMGWIAFRIDRRFQTHLTAYRNVQRNEIGVFLSVYGPACEGIYRKLETARADIDAELGNELQWLERKPGSLYHIAIRLMDTDPRNEEEWPRQFTWMSDWLFKFHDVFAGRIAQMPSPNELLEPSGG